MSELCTIGTVDPSTLGLGALPTAAEARARQLQRGLRRVQANIVGQSPHPDILRDTFQSNQPDVVLAAMRDTQLKPKLRVMQKGSDPVAGRGSGRGYYVGLGADPKPMWSFTPKGGKVEFKSNVGALSDRGKAGAAAMGGVSKQLSGMQRLAVQASKSADAEFTVARAALAANGIDPSILVQKQKGDAIVSKVALPVVGAVVGTFIAPGVGTALGASLGAAASKVGSGQKLTGMDALGIAASSVGAPGVGSAISDNFGAIGTAIAQGAAGTAKNAASSGQLNASSLFSGVTAAFSGQPSDTSSGAGGGFLSSLLNSVTSGGTGQGANSLMSNVDQWSNLFDDGGFSISSLLGAVGGSAQTLGLTNTLSNAISSFGGQNLAQRGLNLLGINPTAPAPAAPTGPSQRIQTIQSAPVDYMPYVIGGAALLVVLAMSRR